jgi:S-adenosylmethionine:tRNA ribosyltransferase-isomerase
MDVTEFDFELPPELIAQEPAPERTAARLLFLDRASGDVTHTTVAALPTLLRAADLLVVNNSRVFPARLLGHRVPSGGTVECLLVRRVEVSKPVVAGFSRPVRLKADSTNAVLKPADETDDSAGRAASEVWEALMHPGQKLKPGAEVVFEGAGAPTLHGLVLERHFYGRRVIRLWTDDGSDVTDAVDAIGHVPLPPYIKRDDDRIDRDRYQTVYARDRGSVAAPTAGLHFTPELLAALTAAGVGVAEVTLHVGYGTFQPVRVTRVEDHRLDAERYTIGDHAAGAINRALDENRRIVAVGTTTTRTLEAVAAAHDGRIVPGSGTTDLFIYPGFDFRVVRGLLTNFHLPRSSLLMLVAAFAGRERVLSAYHAAVAQGYRFYSYGDAMLIL